MSLARGFHQALSPWTENEASVELQLLTQRLHRLFVLLDGLVVELRGFAERGLEVLNLLAQPVQEVMTCVRISGPRVGIVHKRYYRLITSYFKCKVVDFRLLVQDVDTVCVAAPSPDRCRRE